MKRRGFTIVELIIVITIMGILLTLGVVNLRGAQANGRDVERKTDIETIAQHLEAYYTSGTDGSTTVGTYPSTSLTGSATSMELALRDLDINSVIAPGIDDGDDNKDEHAITTFKSAADGTILTNLSLHPTINEYVYQPLHSNGTICSDTAECRKFNLYYRSEVDNNVYMISSVNQ